MDQVLHTPSWQGSYPHGPSCGSSAASWASLLSNDCRQIEAGTPVALLKHLQLPHQGGVMRYGARSIMVTAISLMFAASAMAQKLSNAETEFLQQAAQNGHAEVQSSKLAQAKTTDPRVKSFARQMVVDHSKTGDELKALAATRNLEVPDGPSMLQTAKMKVLGASDGVNFDRRYVSEMGVEAHEETVELFEKAARQARDGQVKSFIAKTLPTLKHHLVMARELNSQTQAAR
jgi:putative membrane protein